MTKVINPSDSAIEIQYRGVFYRVDAGGSLDRVPDEAAQYWKTMIHNFVALDEDDTVSGPQKQTIEIQEDVIVPREEIVEAIGEDAVAAIEAETEVSNVEVVVVPAPKKNKK